VNVWAADNALMVAGYYLDMLTEPRPAKDRVVLLESAHAAIQNALKSLEGPAS
jgi:hypothetical protein